MKSTKYVNVSLVILIILTAFNSFVSPMLTKGMFLDGMIYADLARKVDYSNLWLLNIGDYGNTLFYDHPPLVFWLQGLFFKLFGDYFWIEHCYSILMFLALCYALHLFVKNVLGLNESIHSLIIILLMLLAPIIPWSFSNNMLENTTTVLTLFSSYFLLLMMKNEVNKWKYMVLASIFLTLGFLAKGPVCLFPIAIPFFYLILYPKERASNFIPTIYLGITLTILAAALYAYEPSRLFLSQYFDQQILAALKGKRAEVSENRFRILKCLFNNTLFYVALALVFLTMIKSNSITRIRKQSFLLLIIGFSASLPLLLTPKQACVYLVPALPYFLLAMYHQFRDLANIFTKFLDNRIAILAIVVLGLLASYLASQNRQRLPKLSKDAVLILEHVPSGENVNLVGLCSQYEIPAFLMRYDISSGECDTERGYYISKLETKDKSALAKLSIGWLYRE